MKKIVFLSGTRADYGKLKSLMRKIDEHKDFELHIFVTGMHLLSTYGSTYKEVEKDGFKNIYKYINQKTNEKMDIALSNTILGFSNYVSEIKPDMIVVHGDRIEALAGALVGALNNIKLAHIEGGEVSGTIDESTRHAITKFAHLHFVANEEARNRIMQLGEKEASIFIIGSPDIDIMLNKNLPNLESVKKHYEIDFKNYALFMYHPVTTEVNQLQQHIKEVVDGLLKSDRNYVVIYPNNDEGSQIIINEFKRLQDDVRFKIFPSIRFESFLTLLKNCDFVIGNSSAGVRETSVYGIPTIDIGNRQQGRYDMNRASNIIHTDNNAGEILKAVDDISIMRLTAQTQFGEGKSDEKFIQILERIEIWSNSYQKKFVDILGPKD